MKRGKHAKRILALILGLAMLPALASGCTPTRESDGGQNSPVVNTGSNASYAITANSFGTGVYPFDTGAACGQSAADILGMTSDVTDNKFTTDKSIAQLQNQLASTPDRVASLSISETLFPVAVQYCKNAETPYVFFACTPKDEDVATFEQDEYYVGTMVHSPQGKEAGIAELALANGCRTAVVSASASDDYAHDRHIVGFTGAFEADGGEVLFVSHSTDSSEGVQKTNGLLTTYPDVDCVYACDNDYVAPAAGIVKSRGLKGYKIYGVDISPNICQLIMDDEVEACSGDMFASCGVAIALLVNYLDGNIIRDSEGKTPCFDSLELFTMISNSAKDFYRFLSDEVLSAHTTSGEKYQNLLVHNNAEVNYNYYVDFVANYAEDVHAKVEANANRA